MDQCQPNGSLGIPDELLTRIFQFTLSGFWYINRYGREEIKTGATYYDALSFLRGVCVIWRELIDSSPGFWALVESTVPNIEACLAKSRNVPLTIALRLTGSDRLELVNWERGLEVISRGETVSIECCLEGDWVDGDVSALEAGPAPMLQEIRLTDSVQGVSGRIVVDLFGGIAPRLRKLKLYHIGLKKWNSPLLFNLKELSLISTPGPTMTELLSILEASSDLESLEVFLRHIDGITPASTPSHSVSLLRLSKLNVLSPNPAISNRFLHSIKAPSCCYSTIQFVGQAQDLAICPECVSVPFRSFLITAEEVNLLIHSASLEPSFFLIRGKEKDQSLFRLEWHGLTLHSIGSTLFPTLFPESPTVQISLDLQSTDNLDVLLEESSVWTLSGVKKIKWAGERLVRALMYAKVVDGQPDGCGLGLIIWGSTGLQAKWCYECWKLEQWRPW
ncbi:hypothetical protein FRB95_002332 [Tulasnella sp. JGI-2019a]|nr:hypothetical protein FRB95_002332 [Tulasnella sp. JGI-2019a]